MYNSLRYIQRKFPYFLDMNNSNTRKITELLDKEFMDICDSLEKIKNGYYFLNNHMDYDLVLDKPPFIYNNENKIIFTTSKDTDFDHVEFTSKYGGYLGSSVLEGDAELAGELHEHISIKPETIDNNLKKYSVMIYATDIKEITVKNITTDEETTRKFNKGTNYYVHNIPPSTDSYQITVQTYNEYTYTSYTNQYNPDLDNISASYTGCVRRNYNNLAKTIMVESIVDTYNGDNKNNGKNMKNALKSLRKALKSKIIGFIGSEEVGNISITHNTTIIGDKKSELINTYFWVEPNQKLTLKNLYLNNKFITEQTVINNNTKTILIGG